MFLFIYSFSITKWIHLNWGDEGIKKLFQKVSDLLVKGGLFILEPQNWKSYNKRKCRLSKVFYIITLFVT